MIEALLIGYILGVLLNAKVAVEYRGRIPAAMLVCMVISWPLLPLDIAATWITDKGVSHE